jgi:hypothetical protein
MQPNELEARCCRKEKNAMAKSLKSRCCKGRCCKADAVKVNGLLGGCLFDIGVYPFSRPRRVAIYILGQTRLLADHGTVYLHLKTKTTKIEKDSRGNPLLGLNFSDHRRISLTVLFFLQSADCLLILF